MVFATAALLLAAVHGNSEPLFVDEHALGAGDECDSSDLDGCALNALQRGRRATTQGSEALPVDGPGGADSGIVEPDIRAYSGLDLEDLGLDELDELARNAAATAAARRANVSLTAPEEASEASLAATGCGMRAYSGRQSGTELCFCQLVGNFGCSNSRCVCPQGCSPSVVWNSGETVTFKNKARAQGCSPSAVLLTVTKSYYRDTSDLRHHCGGGAVDPLTVMLENSWDLYQSKVGSGPVNQCFHNPRIASVKYLHLQTFCFRGQFHAMPTGDRKNGVGFCVTMYNRGQASALAQKLFHWL